MKYLFWIDTATMVFNKLTLEAMPDLVLKSLYHWFHEISCCWSQVFRSIEEKLLAPHPYGIMWL